MFYFIPKLMQKNWIHIVTWAAMLIYIVAAPPLYTHYVLKAGKPISFDDKLPQTPVQIPYAVEQFNPVVFHGQNLYNLWGWAFIPGEVDQSAYERLIVLQSDNRRYFFSITNQAREDVQAAFPDMHLNLNTGFSTYISKDVIEYGTYRIGILFKHRTNNTLYYLVTDKNIIRTPNKLQLLTP